MQQTVRNVPVGCPKCGIPVNGQERQVTKGDKIVTECHWRCRRCGSNIRYGITNIADK